MPNGQQTFAKSATKLPFYWNHFRIYQDPDLELSQRWISNTRWATRPERKWDATCIVLYAVGRCVTWARCPQTREMAKSVSHSASGYWFQCLSVLVKRLARQANAQGRSPWPSCLRSELYRHSRASLPGCTCPIHFELQSLQKPNVCAKVVLGEHTKVDFNF